MDAVSGDLQKHGSDACLAYFLAHTIGIINGVRIFGTEAGTGRRADEEQPGTGFPVKWNGHNLLLTARHVLHEAKPTDLRVATFKGELQFKAATELTFADIAKDSRLRGPATIHRCDWEDLAAVSVQPEEFPDLDYFDVASNSFDPPADEWINVCGFPSDHRVTVEKRLVGRKEEVDIALYATVFSSKVLPPPSADDIKFLFDGLEPQSHFLLEYNIKHQSQHPRGFSGAAALWESDEKHLVWRPNFKFAGTVTHSHRNGSLIRVVRAPLVLRFLQETLST